MLETHLMTSSLIFRLVLILVLCHALLIVLCLSSLMDLTIAHMILVHVRTALCLDALDTSHVLIVVIVSCVGLVFFARGSRTHFEPRHFDGPHFLCHGSRSTGPNGEVQRIVKTASGCMVKC
jgi:hypothetical protein